MYRTCGIHYSEAAVGTIVYIQRFHGMVGVSKMSYFRGETEKK